MSQLEGKVNYLFKNTNSFTNEISLGTLNSLSHLPYEFGWSSEEFDIELKIYDLFKIN